MAITIINQRRELTKVEQYLMTLSPSIKTIKDVEDGTKITVKSFIVYEDIKEDETSVNILSILTPDNSVYATNSATFKRAFTDIAEIMDTEETFTIIKTSGTSKNGRPYVNCELDVTSL